MYHFTPQTPISQIEKQYDVIVLGGGHNGLVAAAYLSKAGKKVLVLEKNAELGGATTSVKPFKGVEAYLSRYSYLVALLPQQIINDLGIDFKLLPRRIVSYTPDPRNPSQGLLISQDIEQKTQALSQLTGSQETISSWEAFYAASSRVATAIADTFLSPLPTVSALKEKINPRDWEMIIDTPIGKSIREAVEDDLLRGVIATDALIGHFVDIDDDFSANLCFLYHLVGDWKVPQGGMGKLVHELVKVCERQGVHFLLNAPIVSLNIEQTCPSIQFQYQGQIHEVCATYVLSNLAPQILNQLAQDELTTMAPKTAEAQAYHVGAQVKVNFLLKRLPILKSGEDPKLAFCGTFHVNEQYSQLTLAYEQAKQGKIPEIIPCELYCHTLTDPSILSPELIEKGYHTLTLFALQLPAQLFKNDLENQKKIVLQRILEGLNQFLVTPIEECLAQDEDGQPCIEIKVPQELEKEISLPSGNIFHRYFSKPYLEDAEAQLKAMRGIETKHPRIFLCGAGAVRGGGVSGIPGYQAAHQILSEEIGKASL